MTTPINHQQLERLGFALRGVAYPPATLAPLLISVDGVNVSVRWWGDAWRAKCVTCDPWLLAERVETIEDVLAVCRLAGIEWIDNQWRLTDGEVSRRRRDADALSKQFGEGRTYDYTHAALANHKPGHYAWGSSPSYTGD